MASPTIFGIVGPTASGKTELAMAVAAQLPVEIVVADSRQVYRGMDVGTAKPDSAARAAVRHHLVDLVQPDQQFTVARWVAAARELIPEIVRRSRTPLLVGGTGLYLSALLDGHDYAAQAWSPAVRASLAAELEAEGLPPLAERLARQQPALAARTDLRNPRRVLRALERIEVGGGGAATRATPYPGHVVLMGLSRPRDELYRRINDRAAWLFEHGGLLEEVRRLVDAGVGPDLAPMTGHGYREAWRHLSGEWTLDEAIETTARRTRQYAKRQLSWFRRDPRITWLAAGDARGDDPPVVRQALGLLR
jgi:tRNA dimethylallyltransferase